MKIIEILELNEGLLNICRKLRIKVDDVAYIGLYTDYRTMVANGEKVSYAIAVVAKRYGVCERKAYALVKRLGLDCNGLFFVRGG